MISQSIPQSEQDVKDLLMQIGSNYALLTPDQRTAILSIFPNAPVDTDITASAPEKTDSEEILSIYNNLLARLTNESIKNEDLDLEIRSANEQLPEDKRLDEAGNQRLHLKILEDFDAVQTEDSQVKLKILRGVEELKGKTVQNFYQNEPNRGIVLLKEITDRDTHKIYKTWETVFAYYISEITKYENPVDTDDTKYSVVFRSSSNRNKCIRFHERQLNEIFEEISKNLPGMMNKSQTNQALSTIFYAFDIEGKIKIEQKLQSTGFFLQDKKIIWGETSRFKVKLPDHPKKTELLRGLQVLEQVLNFYPESSRNIILTYLYYYIQAPLGLIRKQAGLENKMLLAYGIPHTGKTWLAKYGSAIWGIPDDYGVIGAAALSAPQLADHFNLTTLPICLDETRNMFCNPTINEMLKSASTNRVIKERIDPKANYRKTTFYAYASLVLTTNFVPDLYTGLEERIIPVEFSNVHKNCNVDAIKDFEHLLFANRETLAHIGSALRWMYLHHSDTIYRLITNNNQIKAGYELLSQLCLYFGIQQPEWVQLVEVQYTIENPDFVQILYNFLRDSYLAELRKHYKGSDIPDPWPERLMRLQERNILPTHTRKITGRHIILQPGIIREIAKVTGYEISGGARGLSFEIPGAEYGSYGGGRWLKIPVSEFERNMSPNYTDVQDVLPVLHQ